MSDFIEQHKTLFRVMLISIFIIVVSLFLTCLIWSLFTVEYKGPGSLEKEKFSYFNVSNLTEYQEGTSIVHLRTLNDYNFKINNETVRIKEVYIIQDNETQKFYIKKYTYENCNDDILIGDKECKNYTIYKVNVFIHKDVSEEIDAYYEELRLLGKYVYMENYIVNIDGVK